jgi:hypothetical protein
MGSYVRVACELSSSIYHFGLIIHAAVRSLDGSFDLNALLFDGRDELHACS